MKGSLEDLWIAAKGEAPRRPLTEGFACKESLESLHITPLQINSWALGPPASPPMPAAAPRCSVKGCVFPAASGHGSTCIQHGRQIREPSLFLSHQPSMLLLDRAKFGLLEPAADDSRAKDRRRLAKIRERMWDA